MVNSISALEKFIGGKNKKDNVNNQKGGAVGYSFNLSDDVSGHGEAAIMGYDNRVPEGNPYFINGGKRKSKKCRTKKRSMRSKKALKGRKMRKTRKTIKRSRK